MKLASSSHRSYVPLARRTGVSSLEVLVAFTLLAGMLGISTSLMVKHGRITQNHRHYRVALDELANQIEVLSSLPEAELAQAVGQLQPSEFAAAQLPGTRLEGELHPADHGQRLVVRLSWDEPQRNEAPVTLVAWIMPKFGTDSSGAAAGGRP